MTTILDAMEKHKADIDNAQKYLDDADSIIKEMIKMFGDEHIMPGSQHSSLCVLAMKIIEESSAENTILDTLALFLEIAYRLGFSSYQKGIGGNQ